METKAMKQLIEILKMSQIIQCGCLGSNIAISIFTNKNYFSVSVQRADRDYEVIYSEKFYSGEENTVKFGHMYSFIVDEQFKDGYTLQDNRFINISTAVRLAG